MKFVVALVTFFVVSINAQAPPGCEKMPKIKFADCCRNMPDVNTIINDQIKQECGIVDRPKGKNCEPINCGFKKLNLLTTANKIDINAANSVIDSNFSGDWISVGKAAAEKCVSETDRYSGDCISAVFTGCFVHNLFTNCPASSYVVENQECSALKTFIDTCVPPAN